MAYRTDPQRKVEAIQLRKDGMLVADIADKLFPCDDAGINRVQSLLEDQPRRIACMGGTLEGRGPVQGGSHPMMLVAR